jgi:glycosyltransferase involved in cell wall biosynthesis
MRRKASILPGVVKSPAESIPHAQRAGYIAWVAMLREVKRPDVLIDIARRLPQVNFVVCGGPTTYFARSGYGEEMIKKFRSLPNIDYRGHVSPDVAVETIRHAAALISTSDEEGFPSTFLEAWAAGTPVISLHLDPGDVIRRFALGTVPGNVLRAVGDISSLIASVQRRDEIAKLSRDYIATHHSENAVALAFQRAIPNVPTFVSSPKMSQLRGE